MRLRTGVVAVATAVCLLGCAHGIHPGTTAASDSITPAELEREMEAVRGLPDVYPILFALAGGGFGALAGWHVGCALHLGGGDDPGLEGCVVLGAGGAITGLAIGSMIGENMAAEWRRQEAVRRIKARRRG